MNREKLMDELRYSLPSRRIIEATNFCAIKIGSEYFVLKDRMNPYKLGSYVTDNIDESKLTDYKEIRRELGHDYKELMSKSILIDKRILGQRGLNAIVEYLESKEMA